MRRYLVVANQTLGGLGLMNRIRERHKAEPSAFYVLVPNTRAADYRGVPAAGGHVPMPSLIGSSPATDQEAAEQARQRLERLLRRIDELGAKAEGSLGPADPVRAIGEVLASHEFDEIIISTLPQPVSRWLRADIPHEVQRRFGLPVTVIVSRD